VCHGRVSMVGLTPPKSCRKVTSPGEVIDGTAKASPVKVSSRALTFSRITSSTRALWSLVPFPDYSVIFLVAGELTPQDNCRRFLLPGEADDGTAKASPSGFSSRALFWEARNRGVRRCFGIRHQLPCGLLKIPAQSAKSRLRESLLLPLQRMSVCEDSGEPVIKEISLDCVSFVLGCCWVFEDFDESFSSFGSGLFFGFWSFIGLFHTRWQKGYPSSGRSLLSPSLKRIASISSRCSSVVAGSVRILSTQS